MALARALEDYSQATRRARFRLQVLGLLDRPRGLIEHGLRSIGGNQAEHKTKCKGAGEVTAAASFVCTAE
jgi:hypothetical protein